LGCLPTPSRHGRISEPPSSPSPPRVLRALHAPPAQALFRALSVFAGGCPFEVAEALGGEGDPLSELVEASMVGLRDGRVGMLETVREYGFEQLLAAGEADLAWGRLVAFSLTVAERGDIAAVGAEHGNLRAALWQVLERQDSALALRLCAALSRFWLAHGHLAEGLAATRDALALPGADRVPPAVRLAVLQGATRIGIELSCPDVPAWSAELVRLARQGGTETDVIAALNTRGLLARLQDRYADAITDHEEALALAQMVDDRAGRAAALVGLAYNLLFNGDSALARELAEQGAVLAREVGSWRSLEDGLMVLAWHAAQTGATERSRELATECLEIYRTLGDTGRIADALRTLGTIAQLSGQYEEATGWLREAEQLLRERGDEHTADQLLAHLAHTVLGTGDVTKAGQLAYTALASAQGYGDLWAIAMAMTIAGHVELVGGNINGARTLFEKSRTLFDRIGNPLYLSGCLEGLAGVALADGRPAAAARLCAEREELLARLNAQLPPMHPPSFERTLAAVASPPGRRPDLSSNPTKFIWRVPK
jgi:tetratricopeptide (TPR) repeat protein